MNEIFKEFHPEVQEILEIALLTECDEDAIMLLNAFFDARPIHNREKAFSALESFGARFKGINALLVFEYDFTDVHGNNLYLTARNARLLRDSKKKIRVITYE